MVNKLAKWVAWERLSTDMNSTCVCAYTEIFSRGIREYLPSKYSKLYAAQSVVSFAS